jgi:hypothetical protein
MLISTGVLQTNPTESGLHMFMQEAGTMAAADAKEAASKRTSGIGLWPFTQRQSMDTGAHEDSVTGAFALHGHSCHFK